tara:strand:+ start:479 stop:1504 length:1026 start_codon:yes stop_codon:yes gene_type:complete
MAIDFTEFNSNKKNVLITGANSGIGFYASIQFLKNENYLYVPLKSDLRKKNFLDKLSKFFNKEYLDLHLNIIEDIDLSDLENIKKLKEYFLKNEKFIDILILNAGIQYTGALYPKVSRQGLELTFAVNHLAHFFMVNHLFPLMNESEQSRIVITSSDVHNPKSSGGNVGQKAGLDNLENFMEEISGRFVNFSADKAYKNSKLCNILFAKELSKKLIARKSKVSVITWAPGLVIPKDDLGFFRYSSQFNKFGYILFSFFANNILGISESVEDAGEILFKISISKNFNNSDYIHLSNVLVGYKKHKLDELNVSEEANNSSLAKKLWDLSINICSSFGFTIFEM